MAECVACRALLPYGSSECTYCGVLNPEIPPNVMRAPPSMGIAVAGLVLNVILWPGLGSIVAGRMIGWAQGFLFLLGVLLTFILIGFPILIGVWVWALVTGVELINEASKAERAQAPTYYLPEPPR